MMMKLVRPVLAGLALLCVAGGLAAKSTTVDGGHYTAKDKEFYLSPEQLLFIRPGLAIDIQSVVIPADRQLEVTYSLKDPGDMPLDIDGIYTPGAVDMRYMLAFIPMGEEQKVRLTAGSRDSGGTLTALGDGVYLYKFGTVLAEDYQMDATYTLALVGRRDLQEFDLDRYVDNEVHHFVPSGNFAPKPRDVVRTATCNGRCHDPLALHGGRYREIQVCTQCHNPGLVDEDSGRSYSFNVLIHRFHDGGEPDRSGNLQEVHMPAPVNNCEMCHTGGIPTADFPLVASPNPVPVCDSSRFGSTKLTWGDPGTTVEIRVGAANGPLFTTSGSAGSKETGKWINNDTKFYLVDKATGSTVQKLDMDTTTLGCASEPPGIFRGEAGTQHTNWMTRPARLVCGGCHEDIDWETGAGHAGGAQDNDNSCGFCHQPDSGQEFDASVRGAHQQLFSSSQFPGLLVELISVRDTDPGDYPTVEFLVRTKSGTVPPLSLDRLRFALTGPNTDYTIGETNEDPQETVDAVKWNGSAWEYTLKTALPMDASGSYTISAEGRSDAVDIDFGDEVDGEREYMENPRLAFAVGGGTATARREVISDYNCESCHVNISFHGGNRKNVQYCSTCHRPERLDLPMDESVHFKWMIHKIHRGEDLENGYVVIRSRGTYDFSHIEFSGDLRNCEKCHVNDSYEIPLAAGAAATLTPANWWSPTLPTAAACISCHDSDAAAAHAFSNTSPFGEACAACHGDGMTFSVERVHAR
jgi:hypothetical protein